MNKQYFGTDGIRGRVGQEPMTPSTVLKLGWAVGKVLASQSNNKEVLIGKDTRISGYLFESALESGLSAAGMNCQLLGPMPTPAIALPNPNFSCCGRYCDQRLAQSLLRQRLEVFFHQRA